jgi:hypothetical protein
MRGRSAAAVLVVAAVAAAGCGAEDFPNEPRPPAPIELSAKVDDRNVVVVPDDVGAGLATVTISNQSEGAVELSFDGPNTARTREIAAGETGSVQFQLETGDYIVESNVPTIQPGQIVVGPERESAKNDLLLP